MSGAEIAGSKPAEPALLALMRQVPEVDAVSVAVSEVALLNVQSVAVPLVTVYVSAPVPLPPVLDSRGIAVYEDPL